MTMDLWNIADEPLLVSPQAPWARLSVMQSGSGNESPGQIAEDALAQALDPSADPQVVLVPLGSVYLGPGEEVQVTSRVAGGASVNVLTDYYATIKWTLAQAAASWAIGKAKSALLLGVSPRDSVLRCASDLQVSQAQIAAHPDPGDLVHSAMLAGADCLTLMKVFAPSESRDQAAQEVEDFSKEFVTKLPPDVWDGILRGAAQLLHDR
jgi:hypothetical protein